MKIRFLLYFLLGLGVSSTAFSQTIHKDQLGKFQASVFAVKNRTGGYLISTEFEELTFDRIDRVSYWDPNISKEMRKRIIWLGYRKFNAPEIDTQFRNIFVVPLQDIAGHERQNHILSFWEAQGDSLKFKFFDPSIRLGGINYLAVREILIGKGSNLLVVTECFSTDHGVFGKYEFAVCNLDSQTVRHLYRDSYSSIANDATGDTLHFELIETGNQVRARMIRRHLSFSKGEKTKFGYKRVQTVTKTDTTTVDLIYWSE